MRKKRRTEAGMDFATEVGLINRSPRCRAKQRRDEWHHLEVFVDQATEAFTVFVFHVHELNAATIRAYVSYHCSEVNFAKAGTDFQLDGITHAQTIWRLEVCPTKTDRSDPSHRHLWSSNLRA